MDEKLSGIESSAIGLLKRAVELDSARRFTESLVCYQEGIQLLLDVCKGESELILFAYFLNLKTK